MTYRDQPWHRECLVCTGCQTPLAGQQFTSREDDPYCVTCFGELFAPKCSSCKRPITGGSGGPKTEWVGCRRGAGDLVSMRPRDRTALQTAALILSLPPGLGGGKYVSFEDRHWHHSCFSCARCSTSLVGQGFVPDGDQVLCQGCSQAGP